MTLDIAPRRGQYVIYAIHHVPSGRKYIGQSMNFAQRIWTHKSALRTRKHWCAEMQSDWTKDGRASFTFDILEICSSKEEANKSECVHIFANTDNCYNYLIAVDPQSGALTPTNKLRQTHSEKIKAAWNDPTSDLRNPRRKRWDDPKQKEIQSKSQKRRYRDPEQRALTAEATRLGQTDETRRLKSEAAKRSWINPDGRQRTTRRLFSKKQRAEVSQRFKKWHSDPANEEKRLLRNQKIKEAWARRKAAKSDKS